MKYQDNITEVEALQPDYLGFIFYDKSPRFFDGTIPQLPKNMKKVGVFVNASLDYILRKIKEYKLDVIQLHGEETPEYCKNLKQICHSERNEKSLEIIKVFSIKDEFDFSILKPYESVCDYFLFDTKGKLPGGNGYTFDWSILRNYSSTKPYFLSGGIGLNEINKLNEFKKSEASKYCFAIDINSKFEIDAGLKNVKKLKEFKNKLSFRT